MNNEDAPWCKTNQTYSILTCCRFARRWKIHRSCVKLHQRVAPSSFALLHASVPQEFFRGAIIVALTIPFALLLAAICLDLNSIPANLLSLGALDFGMVVDGSVVIIENIVRHFALTTDAQKTPLERIRDAVSEVIRPVFFARAIIIAAYLPIFTLESVEGRLFKPMAWTVCFALLGGLIFSLIIAPVLAALHFKAGVREWRNPAMEFLKTKYRAGVQWVVEHPAITVGTGVFAVVATAGLMVSGV